jgi:hypothetical protein
MDLSAAEARGDLAPLLESATVFFAGRQLVVFLRVLLSSWVTVVSEPLAAISLETYVPSV